MTRGFTLIELLVVVTIIVILLALLVPAMDQAIYQADMAMCAANFKGIATSAVVYAAESQRHYPNHAAVQGWHGPLLRSGTLGIDERRMLHPYMPINKIMVDPLCKKLDLESPPNNLVYASFSLWFGWGYYADTYGPGARMARLGDRFSWNGNAQEGQREFSWDILVADFMRVKGQYWSSHPDKGNIMQNYVETDPASNHALSMWVSGVTPRGEVDYNVARQDGSVTRYDAVRFYDERMVEVPEYTNGASGGLHVQLPR